MTLRNHTEEKRKRKIRKITETNIEGNKQRQYWECNNMEERKSDRRGKRKKSERKKMRKRKIRKLTKVSIDWNKRGSGGRVTTGRRENQEGEEKKKRKICNP